MATRGRPTKYQPDYAKQAYKLCLLGATNEKLASFFEVAVSTVDLWIKTIPEFSGAIKKGRDDADGQVAQSLFHRAIGYSHKAVKVFCYQGKTLEHQYTEHYPPDPVSCIFWLKNRQPQLWRDKQVIEQEGDDSLLKELSEALKNSPTE